MNKFIIYTLAILMSFTFSSMSVHAQSAASLSLHGWAWSWTTGWIKLSSKQVDSNGMPLSTSDNSIEYGVTFDEATGIASGWAWSPNVGWISFNSDDLSKSPACAGPSGVAAYPAKISVNGTGYKLTGTARAISPTQTSAGWNLLSANGNWNGCIYFDSASMPSNPCPSSDFGVTFIEYTGFSNAFKGQGRAWNAAGSLFGSTSCSAPIGFGGLSFIEFAGVFKSILKQEQKEITIDLTQSGWDGVCKDTDGNITPKSATINYTVNPAQGTTCVWYLNDIVQSGTATLPSGSKTFSITPSASDAIIALKCYNPNTDNKDLTNPKVATQTLVCAECSDSKNNDTEDTKIDIDDLSCHKDCKLSGLYTPGLNSESGNTPDANCDPNTKRKGIPILKEN